MGGHERSGSASDAGGGPRAFGPSDPMFGFARHCLKTQLSALSALRPAPDALVGPEAVHQTRVCTRRIRAALRVFRDVLPADEAIATLKVELRWFARALGEVRDLDVHLAGLDAYLRDIPTPYRATLARFRNHLQDRSRYGREELAGLFAGDRYLGLLALCERLELEPPADQGRARVAGDRLRVWVPRRLKRAAQRVRRQGRAVTADAPDEALHRLRIACKRLRYELEFHGEVYPDALRRPLKLARRMQDLLGEHQDAVTASRRLEAYAETLPESVHIRGELIGIGRLLQVQDARAAAVRRRFPGRWRRFIGSLPKDWSEHLRG